MPKARGATWSEIKAGLAAFDRAKLLALLRDLHALGPDNRAFLAARLGTGTDLLVPFETAISRWIYPDLASGQDISVANAKKAIADYRKAVGDASGMAALCVFYCEQAARAVTDYGLEDAPYYDALVRMFQQALAKTAELPAVERDAMLRRLDTVRGQLSGIGWGVSDAVNEAWDRHSA